MGPELAGLILYGVVAGTRATGRIDLVAVTASARLRGVGRALIEAALHDLQRGGATSAVVEFPNDPSLKAGRALLEQAGFAEESRIAGYFRDSVELAFLRRSIS